MAVYVIRGENKHKTRYHDEPNGCQSTRGDMQLEEITKAEAERRGLSRCKWCAGEVDNSKSDFSIYKAAKAAGVSDD